MSCNPAIGGLGKGHLVREIDALDGVMGRCADEAGIQFRMLNASRGAAVRGPRAQIDRKLYRAAMQAALARQPGLDIRAEAVEDLLVEDGPRLRCGRRERRGLSRRRGGADHGHLPQRRDPSRRRARRGWPRGGTHRPRFSRRGSTASV